jgi:uncharacterized phage-associated protein
MPVSATDAAKRVCEISGWNVTNLQLQKLLYIIQMVYAGRNAGAPFMREAFEAWDYGPVIPSLYRKVKMFGNRPIGNIFFSLPGQTLKDEEEFIITEACDSLLTKTPAQLVAITHWPGGAWSKNYIPNTMGIRIPQADILEEYRKRVAAGDMQDTNAPAA